MAYLGGTAPCIMTVKLSPRQARPEAVEDLKNIVSYSVIPLEL